MSRRSLVGVAALVAATVACSDSTPKPAALDPVNAEEAAALAKEFEAAIDPCTPAALDRLLDLETILRRASHAADVKAAEREQVYKGMQMVKGQLAANLCAGLLDMTFDLLRIRDVGGAPRPLFRGYSERGVNYYELELGKSKTDKQVRVVDMYMYVAGERLSDTFARLLTAGVAVARTGESFQLAEIGEAHRRGDLEEARRLIEKLPEKLRTTKQVRLMELQLVAYDHPDYRRLVEEFEQAFPDDPSIDLISVDGAYMRGDRAALLRALDRLDRRTGGDPYLDFLRAGAYLLEPTPEDYEKAEAAVRNALTAVPGESYVHVGLLNVLVKRKKYPDAITTLDHLKKTFDIGVYAEKVAGDADWQAFLASREYQDWEGKQR